MVAAKRAYLIEPERSVCLLSGNQLLEDADFTHQYDNNGNDPEDRQAGGAVTSYEYNAGNKLVRVIRTE